MYITLFSFARAARGVGIYKIQPDADTHAVVFTT
jgi:hypothetical protein